MLLGPSPRPWGTLRLRFGSGRSERSIPTPVGNAPRPSPPRRLAPVHPHARGERQGDHAVHDRASGPSPRPWGTRPRTRSPPPSWRSIPTPVGNAALPGSGTTTRAVHPHARGERALESATHSQKSGPSPRPWGTRRGSRPRRRESRSIPTPVGNASGRPSLSGLRAVHPHARGERCHSATMAGSVSGPSPRPWGTPELLDYRGALIRSIPTPVGNAPASTRAAGRPTVHPHARGERVRFADRAALRRRSIPTPVGNAAASCRSPARVPVHPHARGERTSFCGPVFEPSGPSPRPWGTPPASQRDARAPRSIPTPVGNAGPLRLPAGEVAVHPHARGERACTSSGTPVISGPSPRPWGTRWYLSE